MRGRKPGERRINPGRLGVNRARGFGWISRGFIWDPQAGEQAGERAGEEPGRETGSVGPAETVPGNRVPELTCAGIDSDSISALNSLSIDNMPCRENSLLQNFQGK